jgi:hypothetical protein
MEVVVAGIMVAYDPTHLVQRLTMRVANPGRAR